MSKFTFKQLQALLKEYRQDERHALYIGKLSGKGINRDALYDMTTAVLSHAIAWCESFEGSTCNIPFVEAGKTPDEVIDTIVEDMQVKEVSEPKQSLKQQFMTVCNTAPKAEKTRKDDATWEVGNTGFKVTVTLTSEQRYQERRKEELAARQARIDRRQAIIDKEAAERKARIAQRQAQALVDAQIRREQMKKFIANAKPIVTAPIKKVA